jgi:hypothetical protein
MDDDELCNQRIHAIAKAKRCSVERVKRALDRHPIEVDRDVYLKRTLALALIDIEELKAVFREKALSGDVPSGSLLVKLLEREATTLGLNAPIGHAVSVTQHEPAEKLTSTEELRKVLWQLKHPNEPFKLEHLDIPDREN